MYNKTREAPAKHMFFVLPALAVRVARMRMNWTPTTIRTYR
jgi:hypothetical protein